MALQRYCFEQNEPLILESGEHLERFEVAFHCSVAPVDIPALIEQGRRVVWVCHALTANSDPSEWWSDLVGESKCFDSERDIIICANTLGSCYGSTGPSSWSGKSLDFPFISVRDIVSAHILLRRYLAIEKIDILIGGSVGGFQSLEWAILEPQVIDNLMLIACNERITPWATALNESQRMAIEADSTFAEQKSLKGGERGLRAARSMALISYRSYEGYNLTQSESDDDVMSAAKAASYQRYQGKKLSDRFDAYSYYYMTKMLDTHNVGRARGGVQQALESVAAKTLVVAIDSDILFPPAELQRVALMIPAAHFEQISSAFGHDGFLIEWRALEQVINDFLKR